MHISIIIASIVLIGIIGGWMISKFIDALVFMFTLPYRVVTEEEINGKSKTTDMPTVQRDKKCCGKCCR